MREALNAGLRLLLLTLVAALLLSGTYLVTRGPIEEQALASENASRLVVMPDATAFDKLDVSTLSWFAGNEDVKNVNEIYRVSKDGSPIGYSFLVSPNGFGGPVPVTVGILDDGTISAISIGDITETAGIGSRVKEDANFQNAFAGQATNSLRSIDALAGATISSNAVKSAARQAFTAFELIGNPPAAATPAPETAEPVADVDMTDAVLEAVDIASFAGVEALDGVKSVEKATKDGATVGYVVEVEKNGFGGAIHVTVSITSAGKVFDMVVGENNETPGFGSRAIEENPAKYKGLLTGELRSVDTVAGATITSDALKAAVRAAFTAFETLTK